jgi:ubiquinone biosynthesis protein UbiJ
MPEQFSRITLAALNHLLGGANWARERLQPFAGRQARMELPPFAFGFAVDAEGWLQESLGPATPDVTICLPAGTPFLLLQGLDKIMAGAQVSGNAEFATALSFVFRNLRWDAEEDLSKLVGDIAAHRLVQGASRFIAWQQQAARNLSENLAEYLIHENPRLVATTEFSVFRDDISHLNTKLARLEGRAKAVT